MNEEEEGECGGAALSGGVGGVCRRELALVVVMSEGTAADVDVADAVPVSDDDALGGFAMIGAREAPPLLPAPPLDVAEEAAPPLSLLFFLLDVVESPLADGLAALFARRSEGWF